MTYDNSILADGDWLNLASDTPAGQKRRLKPSHPISFASSAYEFAPEYSIHDDKRIKLSDPSIHTTVGDPGEVKSALAYDPLGLATDSISLSLPLPFSKEPATPPGNVATMASSTVVAAPYHPSLTPDLDIDPSSPSNTSEMSLDAASLNALAEKYMYFHADSSPACEMYDSQGKPVSLRVVSKLRGNWHLTLSSISSGEPSVETPSVDAKHLTFYRRNLFSLDSTVSASGPPPTTIINPDTSITSADGLRERLHISKFTITASLLSSAKRKRNAELVDRTGMPAAQYLVNMDKSNDYGHRMSSYEWEKIKFSSATINNGAPNHQPYFEVATTLLAITTSGQQIVVAQAVSRPIIVRGRHPRFYKDRFGIALNGEGASRRSSQVDNAVGYRVPSWIPSLPMTMSAANEQNNSATSQASNYNKSFDRKQYYNDSISGTFVGPPSHPAAAGPTPHPGSTILPVSRHSYEYFPLDPQTGNSQLSYGYYYPHLGHMAGSDGFSGSKEPHRHFYKPLEFCD